jgi:hypothetical protein
MKTLPVPSPLELSILGLLRGGARTGYEIRKSLAASPGAVYPAMRRLEKAGLVAGSDLTALGRRVLRGAASAIDKDELRRGPDAVAARMRFLTGASAAAFLREYGRLCGEIASELRSADDVLGQHDAAVFAARARWAIRQAG